MTEPDDFDAWRDAARALIQAHVSPERVSWSVGNAAQDLFGGDSDTLPPPVPGASPPTVPRDFITLAQSALMNRAPERFSLLYTALWRLRTEPALARDIADPLIRRLTDLAKEVRRDIHKMRAFVRFREIDGRFVAWFEPDHHIVRHNAGFFVRRFAGMRWSILTPERSIHWDGTTLTEGPGATRAEAPQGDPVEDVWKSYYASIFNPARVKIGAMLSEMPRKYWKNMPETALIPELIAQAQGREVAMIAAGPKSGNAEAALQALRDEAMECRRCPLWKDATQTVFGEGPPDARLMFVGEQPGDQEDLAGRPFVGPAGQLFDRALKEAGVDRAQTYVTNAVKHFKYEQRGKRRIHAKPDAAETDICRWWVDQERDIVTPRLTVALGATAARSLTGRSVTISRERSRVFDLADGGAGFITVHPSFLLRLPDEAARAAEYARFVADLRAAWDHAAADQPSR